MMPPSWIPKMVDVPKKYSPMLHKLSSDHQSILFNIDIDLRGKMYYPARKTG